MTMSSLLTFALKRRKAARKSTDSDNNGTVPFAEVTPTSSGETAHSESDDVRDSSFYTADWHSPIEIAVPQTPEGLRPRKSIDELRVELDIPQPRAAAMPFLPPRHNSIPSPQVSNASFYTRTTSGTLVAESPDLSVGRARTAVGALVAQHEQPQSRPSVAFEQSGELGVLPPRDWLKTKNTQEEEAPYHRLDDSLEILTPNRARRSFMSVSPGSTVDASSIHASPSSWRHYQQYQEENYARAQHQQRNDNADLSFSSRLGLVEDGAMRENRAYNFDPINDESESRNDVQEVSGREFVVAASDHLSYVSAISQSTTGPSEKWTWGLTDDRSARSLDSSKQSYDQYNGQDAMDSALLQHKAANQRRNKERLVIDLVQRLQDDTSIVADVDDTKHYDASLSCMFVKTPMDREGLLTGYARENRLRLLNTIAKLLHEMEVVYPEEFFMSPTQIPIIADTHHDLRQALGFLYCIIRTAIPENEKIEDQTMDKFSSSSGSSQAEPKPRWVAKNWLRSSLGIESIPESPETVRGGDTSLFSLPSDSCETPHTSNVSMTTTITSRTSPAVPPSPPPQPSKVRRTIEIAATLVQRLTLACNQLLLVEHCSSKESIRAAEEIKRNYLQLMSLSVAEICSLVSAFSQEVPQIGLARVVSEDDNMDQDAPAKSQAPVMSRDIAPSRPGFMAEMDSGISYCESRTVSFSEDPSRDFFSPRTEDMNSNTHVEEEEEGSYAGQYVDDLRRDVGSYDYEERDEREGGCEREGPPEDSCSGEEMSHLSGRSETGAFPSMPMYYETVVRNSMKEI